MVCFSVYTDYDSTFIARDVARHLHVQMNSCTASRGPLEWINQRSAPITLTGYLFACIIVLCWSSG